MLANQHLFLHSIPALVVYQTDPYLPLPHACFCACAYIVKGTRLGLRRTATVFAVIRPPSTPPSEGKLPHFRMQHPLPAEVSATDESMKNRRRLLSGVDPVCPESPPYWRAGASQPSRFNGRFFSLYIYIYIYLYISGAGRHHTVMFYVILNTRTNVKFQKSSTKLHVFEARLFVMDAAQHSSHIVLCAAKNFPRKLVNGN